jgi:thymidylate kinase
MKKTAIICFLGIDGSGKSTLAKYLCGQLKSAEHRVTYIWWLEGDQSLLRRTLKGFANSSHLNFETDVGASKNVEKTSGIVDRLFKSVYPTVVMLDYLRFALIKAWIPKIGSEDRVIVFDRFMYDVILALSEDFNFTEARQLKLLKLCNLLIPQPDLIFLVDVAPKIAYLRKKEELGSIQAAEKKRAVYKRLDPFLRTLRAGTVIRIDNTQDVEYAKAQILKIALELVEGGCS